MKNVSEFVKLKRKALGLTQEEFAMRAGLGLRFVRELEQGKKLCASIKLIKHWKCLAQSYAWGG